MYKMQEGMLLRPVYQQDRGIYASDLINPIDHQSTKNDRLKPVLTTSPVNTHTDRLFANLVPTCEPSEAQTTAVRNLMN